MIVCVVSAGALLVTLMITCARFQGAAMRETLIFGLKKSAHYNSESVTMATNSIKLEEAVDVEENQS